MGERSTIKHRNAGEMVTLEEFEKWIVDGKIEGEHVDARHVFNAIQSRIWICPECKRHGVYHRIQHSLDDTIYVGNPICPEGHDMVLFEEKE